jgi:predicted phosphodiesterase
MSRVLVIGDTHLPAVHPGYLSFCRDLRDKCRCDLAVHIGDVCDFHAISFHASHPEAPGPKAEYDLAFASLRPWVKAFPTMRVCIGNHDARVIRLAESVKIPAKFLRDYSDVWDTPRWVWADEHTVDDVFYMHGIETSGLHPAFNSMLKMLMSVCQGHVHSAGGIKWRANPKRRIFGMDVGCGVDDRAIAMAYGKHQKVRSILSAGVVIDGVPQHHVMPMGPGEKYHRSKFD